MKKANCVSVAIEILKRDGQVELDAYWLTATVLRSELAKAGFSNKYVMINKWRHIFIATK
jgi:hypothetical protein